MPPISQTHRYSGIYTPFGADVLVLRRFHASEELGRPFEYYVEMFSEDETLSFEDIVGENVTVRLEIDPETTRYFNGYVKSFEMIEPEGGYPRFCATIVPWTWVLTQRWDCRIFQEMSVTDILEQVFKDAGFNDYELRTSATYSPLEYCVQYRESDFNFVSRLMEEYGIYYYYLHENGKHTMVLADSEAAHDPCPNRPILKYRNEDDAHGISGENVHTWKIAKNLLTGAYAQRDFNFKKPKTSLETTGEVARQHAMAENERYDYPGRYVEKSPGTDLTKVRIEEIQAQHESYSGRVDSRDALCGHTFTLEDHFRGDLNQDYLIVAFDLQIVEELYSSGQDSGEKFFSASVRCATTKEPFRSASTSRRPRIPGPQTAIVTGPSGEEIYTDEFGRVKVQFHWDRLGEYNEKSSCWVRVSHAWAGKEWGAFYLPRIGQEVIIEFLEGDPDCPIITGRVYNGESMPPYALPGEKTKSTLKSNSTVGGGGFNEIRFEDKKDSEQIFIHAQKNEDIRVLNDCFEWIGNDRHLIVKNDQLEHIENDRSELVDNDHKEEIGKDRSLKVKGKEAKQIVGNQTLKVGGNVTEEFGGNHTEKTSGNVLIKATNILLDASANVTLKCGGNSVVVDSVGVTVKGSMVTVDGGLVKINSGPGSPPGMVMPGMADSPVAPEKAEEADNDKAGSSTEYSQTKHKGKDNKTSSQTAEDFVANEVPEESGGGGSAPAIVAGAAGTAASGAAAGVAAAGAAAAKDDKEEDGPCLEVVTFKDDNDREPSSSHVLEVVAVEPKCIDKITFVLGDKPKQCGCGGPSYAINGDKKMIISKPFVVNGENKDLTFELITDVRKVFNLKPEEYKLDVKCDKTGATIYSATIKSYTFSKFKVKWDADEFVAKHEKVMGLVHKAFKFITRICGKEIDPLKGIDFRMGAVFIKVEKPKFELEFEGQYKEFTKEHKSQYDQRHWEVFFGFDLLFKGTLIKLSLKVDIIYALTYIPQLAPFRLVYNQVWNRLQDYMKKVEKDKYEDPGPPFYIELAGDIKGSMGIKRQPVWGIKGGLFNEIEFGIGIFIKARIVEADMKASTSTENGVEFASESEAVVIKAGLFKFKGVKGKVSVKLDAGWFGKWGHNKEYTLVEESEDYMIGPETYKLFDGK